MRTIRIILIVLVLIGFPALSWWYLSTGLKWRVGAQEETRKKEQLGAFQLLRSDSLMLTPQMLRDTFYLVATPADTSDIRKLQQIYTQFHVRPDFKILCLLPEGTRVEPESEWMRAKCVEGCDHLTTKLYQGNTNAAIVDDSLYIRGRYDMRQAQDMKKMVEHLAVVLPIDKREKIILKRDK